MEVNQAIYFKQGLFRIIKLPAFADVSQRCRNRIPKEGNQGGKAIISLNYKD
jgi:hypothetical protein